MALRKTLVDRLFNISKTPSSSQTPIPACFRSQTSSNPSLFQRLLKPLPHDEGLRRRFLHQNRLPAQPELFTLPIGEKLIEKVKGLNGNRIRLDVLAPTTVPPERGVDGGEGKAKISAEEVRKVLRVSQVEAVKAKLRGITKSSMSYPEYLQICCESSGVKQGLGLARALDESGEVLVLGNVVFLRPEQVAKAIESVIPLSPAQEEEDPRKEELREMAERKAEIDGRAEAMVRRELWCGLAFAVVQTVGFMRLTFWELSWDVMEPICFYVTSVYFMAGYAFFLRTSKDPSFEGFFQSRFSSKQKRLMRSANFDVKRFNKLCRAIHPSSRPWESTPYSSPSPYCDCCHKKEAPIGAAQLPEDEKENKIRMCW